ncbi:unnamed protein product [Pylaiella littoralis]
MGRSSIPILKAALTLLVGASCGQSAEDSVTEGTPSPRNSARKLAQPAYPDCTGNLTWIGDGFCSTVTGVNNAECGYDGGDCCECDCQNGDFTCGINGYNCIDPATTACNDFPDCPGSTTLIGDGYCDGSRGLNVAECGFDGGDCCACECQDGNYTCGAGGFKCIDPKATTVCPESSFDFSYFFNDDDAYPDCTGITSWIGDGYCDDVLNNEDCGYDDGDCCACECKPYLDYTCSTGGFNCVDPHADTFCTDYPDCNGKPTWFRDGYCDGDLNNGDCGYDGGDCCKCDCKDARYNCGESEDYDCVDPATCRGSSFDFSVSFNDDDGE